MLLDVRVSFGDVDLTQYLREMKLETVTFDLRDFVGGSCGCVPCGDGELLCSEHVWDLAEAT